MKQRPDTTIPCQQCNGTGRKPTYECGACFGTGLSTVSYDQRRNATTITVWNDEDTSDKYRMINSRNRLVPIEQVQLSMENLNEVAVHNATYTEQKGLGGRIRKGYILLISWANPLYTERAAAFAANPNWEREQVELFHELRADKNFASIS